MCRLLLLRYHKTGKYTYLIFHIDWNVRPHPTTSTFLIKELFVYFVVGGK
eukprot:UN07409